MGMTAVINGLAKDGWEQTAIEPSPSGPKRDNRHSSHHLMYTFKQSR